MGQWSVEDLSVGRWSVVGGRWLVSARWFCNMPRVGKCIRLYLQLHKRQNICGKVCLQINSLNIHDNWYNELYHSLDNYVVTGSFNKSYLFEKQS